MNDVNDARPGALDGRLPGDAVPYVVRYGEGVRHHVAGQVVYTLAGERETNGGFAAFMAELPHDPRPIPLHYHEREHDTWICLRGKLQIWCNGQSRVLTPGDFAYAKPNDVHAYQSVAPRSAFFGIVAPGGWEKFFVDGGESWGTVALPPAGQPFDFGRLMAAQPTNDVHVVADAEYVAATPMSAADQTLPNGHESYFLDAGHGPRSSFCGHLATTIITGRQMDGMGDIRLIEGAKGATMAPVRHERTSTFLLVVAGTLSITIGDEDHMLMSGDGANLPAGTRYGTRVASGTARWLACSAGGNGGEMWSQGEATDAFCFPADHDRAAHDNRLRSMSGIDCVVA